MLSTDLSLPEYFHLHLTQSLLVLILGPVQLQLHLYPLLLIQVLFTSLTGIPSSTFMSIQSTNLCSLLL
jgi:hypothetical protein